MFSDYVLFSEQHYNYVPEDGGSGGWKVNNTQKAHFESRLWLANKNLWLRYGTVEKLFFAYEKREAGVDCCLILGKRFEDLHIENDERCNITICL